MQVCIPRRVPDCRPLSRPRSPSQTSGRVLCGEASRPVRNQEFGWTGQPGPCGDPPSQLGWTPEGSFVLQNFAVKQVVPGNTEPCLWRKGLFPGQVSGLGTEAAASGTWGLTDGSGERLHCWFEGLVSFRYKYKKSQKKRKLEEPFLRLPWSRRLGRTLGGRRCSLCSSKVAQSHLSPGSPARHSLVGGAGTAQLSAGPGLTSGAVPACPGRVSQRHESWPSSLVPAACWAPFVVLCVCQLTESSRRP